MQRLGAGAAGLLALIYCAVFSLMLFEQLPADGACHRSILMSDKTADYITLLNLYRNRRILIALRQHACVQALSNILVFGGATGFLVNFGGDIFQIVDPLILVVLKANIGNCAVHQALLYVFPAFIPCLLYTSDAADE